MSPAWVIVWINSFIRVSLWLAPSIWTDCSISDLEESKSKKSRSINKILWKSYKEDESYFKNKNEESSVKTKIKKISEEKKYQISKKLIKKFTEVEPFLPLNNFLDFRKFQIMVRWKSSFDGGVANGTGQQNPSFIFDYGISDSSLLSIYVSGADDDLYNLDYHLFYSWAHNLKTS